MDKQQIWALAEETMQSLVPFYQEVMQKAIQDSGVPRQWFTLKLARGIAPDPLTVEWLQAILPYGARQQLDDAVQELTRLEMLERAGENAYTLTHRGRQAVESIFEAAQHAIGANAPLAAEKAKPLNALLYRLVEGTRQAPEPKDKWMLLSSRWTDPGRDAPDWVRTDQYLTDLAIFRDDAHLAAWKFHKISGHAWEALTCIWRGQAASAQGLVERLPYRAHTIQVYREALDDLVRRGWVIEEAGVYRMTEQGKHVREEAEVTTDRNFYAGWSVLNEAELAQLADLLTDANETLRTAIPCRLWDLSGQVSQGISAVTRDVVNPLLQQRGLDRDGFFFALYAALRLEPEHISAARIGIRNPYTNPARFQNLLSAVAQAGFLVSVKNGEYTLTDEGHIALHEVEHPFYIRLGEIAALPAQDMAQLETLLDKVAQACLNAPEPADKQSISTTRQGHPKGEYAPLALIDQHLDDLAAFRDDAHLAAWKPCDIGGPAWEAFTFIWRGNAHTAEELAEKLAARRHTAEAYAQALDELARRGWVEKGPDGYQVTPDGQALRQQVEEKTDRYFFAPWSCLSVAEMVQLNNLLTRAKNSLQETAQGSANSN